MKIYLVFTIGALAICSSLGYLQAQELVDHRKYEYQGLRNCNMCHGGRGKDNPVDNILDLDYLVKLDELVLWAKNDKHILAGKSLDPAKNQLAQEMQTVLGAEKYNQLKEACIKCHQVGELSANAPEENSPHAPKKNELNFGVSCEACHGPSKLWSAEHNKLSWRKKSPAEKLALGMENFRDPLAKAKLCATCHVGDVKLGRVVTHEMYAAGHPPLPGFEVATFLAAMPAHWQEKYPQGTTAPTSSNQERPKSRAEYLEHIGLQSIHAADTRDLLIGAIVSYETYLTLLADSSKAEAPAAKQNAWPELAFYDCYACHHTLNRGTAANTSAGERISSRQQRGYQKNVPGRPTLQSWQATLAKIALQQANLELSLDPVHKELNTVPFGEQTKLAEVFNEPTQQLRKAAIQLNSDLNAKAREKIPPAQALQEDQLLTTNVLDALIELGAAELQEYDAARQLVWAVERVSREYVRLHPEQDKHRQAFADFTNESILPSPEKDQNNKLTMNQFWKFDLPKRLDDKNPNGQPIAENIADWLQARANYQPALLRQKFQKLRAAFVVAKPDPK